jgi:hypothetical protein
MILRRTKDPCPPSRYLGVMDARSIFIRRPEDAARHVNTLAAGLRRFAISGWISGAACLALALFVSRYLTGFMTHASATSGARETSPIAFLAWAMAIALLVFSTLYFVAGWGLAQKKPWSRYFTAGTFLLKTLLCIWIGLSSPAAMIIFLLLAGWDLYGLWVLMSKEAGQLLSAPRATPASVKPVNPANLAT